MKVVAAVLCLAVLAGCGSSAGYWKLEQQGEAWGELRDGNTVAVVDPEIGARNEKEIRPDDWQTAWPREFATLAAEGITDADCGLSAKAGGDGALVVRLKLDPFYNGNGYSYMGSNPAYCTARATILTRDGRTICTLHGREELGGYMSGGPYKSMLYRLGETLAGWIEAQR